MIDFDAMRGDVPGVAWPPAFTARTGALAAVVQGLERSQWLGARVIASGQRRQLAVLAAHFGKASPWFADRLRSAGLSPCDLGQPGALQRLPLLDRREAQALFAAQHVTDLPAGHAPARKVNTSGSSGEPVIVWKTVVNQLHWLAMTMRWYLWTEPDFAARLAIVRANMTRFGERKDWGAPMSLLFETGPLLRIDIEDDIALQIERLRGFGAQSLSSTRATLPPFSTPARRRRSSARGRSARRCRPICASARASPASTSPIAIRARRPATSPSNARRAGFIT